MRLFPTVKRVVKKEFFTFGEDQIRVVKTFLNWWLDAWGSYQCVVNGKTVDLATTIFLRRKMGGAFVGNDGTQHWIQILEGFRRVHVKIDNRELSATETRFETDGHEAAIGKWRYTLGMGTNFVSFLTGLVVGFLSMRFVVRLTPSPSTRLVIFLCGLALMGFAVLMFHRFFLLRAYPQICARHHVGSEG